MYGLYGLIFLTLKLYGLYGLHGLYGLYGFYPGKYTVFLNFHSFQQIFHENKKKILVKMKLV